MQWHLHNDRLYQLRLVVPSMSPCWQTLYIKQHEQPLQQLRIDAPSLLQRAEDSCGIPMLLHFEGIVSDSFGTMAI